MFTRRKSILAERTKYTLIGNGVKRPNVVGNAAKRTKQKIMGFELWYSRTNKIRRNGTSFKELKQIFIDSISTKQIFEEFDRC